MKLLPHEGLTLEALLAPFKHTVLQPLLTTPLLYALLHYEDSISPRYILAAHMKILVRVLKVLATLGIIRTLNNTLSNKVVNNWVNDTWRPRQEVVVVTGGASGIGALLVKELAVNSKAVIIFDVSEPTSDMPSNVSFHKLDVRSSAEISAAASAVRSTHGDPTVLINNAGVGSPFTLLAASEADIRRVLDINLVSQFLTVKEFLPAMVKANHGHIVTLASLASFLAIAPTVAYSTSKAGVLAFHEALANELKVRYNAPKVRTTIVHPSFVRTPLVTRMLENKRFHGFVLEPQTVVDSILRNLFAAEGGQIIVPGRIVFWSLIRAFPDWLQYGLRNIEGNKIKLIQGQ